MALLFLGVYFPQHLLHEVFFPRVAPPQHYAVDIEGNRKLKLYKAAMNGNWLEAEEILTNYSQEIITPTTRINQLGETALHIAVAADHTKFVQHLVNSTSSQDLTVTNNHGDTAFFYASVCGHIKTARIMLLKNPALATMRGREDMLPIQAAALHGHHRMVRRLYEDAKDQLGDYSCGVDVLIALIDCDAYDMAFKMASEKPMLTTRANNKGETALFAFARNSQITPEKFDNVLLDNILPYRRNKLRTQGFELLRLVLQPLMSVVEQSNSTLIKEAIFVAAKQGNWEFVSTLVHSDPRLAFEVDANRYTIFHIAVLHRHVKVFDIIHEIDSIENAIKLMIDNDENNILHLAGKLPLSGVEVVPGAALQLQRELQWFEDVKKRVGAHQMERAKNREGKTPRELFVEEHEALREKGEQWMKSTASSCMVVSTLVAGVAFASSIKVPGGTKGDTGIPNLLGDIWFKIFAVANAVSLIFSASSIIFFLTIFTSQFSMGDFKRWLPMKLILGLLLLSCAVEAMIVAFVAAFFIIFKHHLLSFAYSIAAIAAIPAYLFIILHLALILYVIYFTFKGFFLFISKTIIWFCDFAVNDLQQAILSSTFYNRVLYALASN